MSTVLPPTAPTAPTVPSLLDLPYRDRQLIILDHHDLLLPMESPKWCDYVSFASAARQRTHIFKIASDVWAGKTPDTSWFLDPRAYGLYGYFFRKACPEETKAILRVSAEAMNEADLQLPPGHPHYRMVYTGHPCRPRVYLPMGRFHMALFEDKFMELLRLLQSIGARRVTMHYLRGYRYGGTVTGAVEMPGARDSGTGEVTTRRAGETRGELVIEFNETVPQGVPSDLVWYPHEKNWQDLVQCHAQGGFKRLQFSLACEEDYGVTQKLAGKFQGWNLNLGGEFLSHEKTEWRFDAEF